MSPPYLPASLFPFCFPPAAKSDTNITDTQIWFCQKCWFSLLVLIFNWKLHKYSDNLPTLCKWKLVMGLSFHMQLRNYKLDHKLRRWAISISGLISINGIAVGSQWQRLPYGTITASDPTSQVYSSSCCFSSSCSGILACNNSWIVAPSWICV